MRFAVFLRGINVGGIKVAMADLRACLAELDVQDVRTFVQTGNVLLTTTLSAASLREVIEKALTATFEYDAHVLVYQQSELAAIVDGYPFEHDDRHHRYVIFCDSQQVAEELAGAADQQRDSVAAGSRVVYWRCPKGETLKTGFSKALANRKLKAVTTNRNLNTVERML